MLRVFSEGDDLFRLEDGTGAHVGAIRGRTISFRGFAAEETSWPRYEPALEKIGTTHDGAYEWFYDGTKAIARLVRPRSDARDRTFGIELVLPSFASEGVAITAAHGMARAIAPHREGRPNEALGVTPPTQPYVAAEPLPSPSPI